MDSNFMYMQVSGLEVAVEGEVTAAGFDDRTWFQVDALAISLERGGEAGADAAGESKESEISGATFTKEMDAASIGVFNLVKARDPVTVICKFVATGSGGTTASKQILTWAQYKFEQCYFTSYNPSDAGETVNFEFESVEIKFWPRYAHGKRKAARTTCYP